MITILLLLIMVVTSENTSFGFLLDIWYMYIYNVCTTIVLWYIHVWYIIINIHGNIYNIDNI
jgi:hypothetical protein